MKPKALIPLVIILALLAGLVLWQQRGEEITDLETQLALRPLTPDGLTPGGVTRFELYAGADPEERVALERDNGEWRITSHYNAPANAATVQTFLEKLAGLRGEYRASPADDSGLETYGLRDEEAFHVTAYAGQDSPAVHILVGNAPDHATVFMREHGARDVYVEAANLRREAGVFGDDPEAAPTFDKWLDREVLALDRDRINGVELTMPDKRLRFERQERELPDTADEDESEIAVIAPETRFEWVLAEGGPLPEHRDIGLDNVLVKLAGLNAQTIADPAERAELGLDDPPFTLRASLDDGGEVVLRGARKDPTGGGHVFREDRPGIYYEVTKFNFEQVFPKGSDLFDLPALALDKDAIESIEIAAPEERIVIANAAGVWEIEHPRLPLDPVRATIDGAVNALANWAPADYADPDLAGDDFDTEITVRLDGREEIIRLGAPAKSIDGRYARRGDDGPVFVMGRADLSRILLQPRDIYAMRVTDVLRDTIDHVDILLAGESIALSRHDDGWTVADGGTAREGDPLACDDLLSLLVNFQPDGLRTDLREAAWLPHARIAMTTSGGDAHVFNFGPLEDGVHPLQVDGKPVVYTVSPEEFAPITEAVAEVLATAAIPAEEIEETAAEEFTPEAAPEALAPPEPAAPVDAEEDPAAAAPEDLDIMILEGAPLEAAPGAEIAPEIEEEIEEIIDEVIEEDQLSLEMPIEIIAEDPEDEP